MKTDKTILTLKWEGNVFTADLPWDTDMPTLTQAFKGLAIALPRLAKVAILTTNVEAENEC
jgi:hypothetical protein